jgi:hypothetical protein
MKPVNLLPSDSPVVAANAGKPNVAALGGAAFGFIAVVAVAGYFAMARVDSVKSETAALTQRTTEATNETTAVNSQVASLGQPVVDSDKELAKGQEAVLVSAYTERHDFPELAAELQGIMEDTGGWYESIQASTGGGDTSGLSGGGKAVTIVGIMPTEQLAAAFEERVSATRTLANAEITALESEILTELDSKRDATYWRFTIQADLVDTVAPSASGATGGSTTPGTTVGAGSGELSLSLESEPKPKVSAKAAAKPAKPKNPFDIAAAAAVRGGGA